MNAGTETASQCMVALQTCPACAVASSTDAGSFPLSVPGHPLDGYRMHLRRCSFCGLTYVNPRPARQLLGGFIPDPQGDSRRAALWTRRLQTIRSFGVHGRLLDVGPGAGGFIAAALRQGWEAEALELQPHFAESLAARLEVPVHIGTLDGPHEAAGQFNAVTAWDVIEHVESIGDMLAGAARAVRPGGVLALSTIHAASLNAQLLGCRWIFWNVPGTVPEHLQAFTRLSLDLALRRAGFRPTAYRTMFQSAAMIAEAARRVRPDDRLGSAWYRWRASPPGRAAAYLLWRSLDAAGWAVDGAGGGDILEVYAVRVRGSNV